ncbi:hypothetical protein CYMTET_11975 [Cymbomonas tetramitiformis]|uniref:Uncharacterized protein n=1 Tax=Cymbomonas tetramitiformis TaxID=36881 RepID=A0AAE0LCX4_9CHLO|nr:hypothetical protein CYMTET_11975 [Cymbomonas tetramitiformis]
MSTNPEPRPDPPRDPRPDPLGDEKLLESLGAYLQRIPDGPRLVSQFGRGIEAKRKGRCSEATQLVLSIGVELYHRPDVDPNAVERFLQIAVGLASFFDTRLPEHCYHILSGYNSMLGDATAWLGNCLSRMQRFEEAEQCYLAAAHAVRDSDVREIGEKLLCAAQLHRLHTRNVIKHKALLTRWETLLSERKNTEVLTLYLESKANMLQERVNLYTVRNKLDKGYSLAAGELLTIVNKLQSYPLRRRPGFNAYAVHDLLGSLALKQGEHAKTEKHLRDALRSRLVHYKMAEEESEDECAAEPEEEKRRQGATASSGSRADASVVMFGSTDPAEPSSSQEEKSAVEEHTESQSGRRTLGLAWNGEPSGQAKHDTEVGRNVRRLADHLQLQKRHLEAAEALRAAIRCLSDANPSEGADALTALGSCFMGLLEAKQKSNAKCSKVELVSLREKATEAFSDGLHMHEGSPRVVWPQVVEVLLRRAEALWQLDRPRESEDDLTRALQIGRDKLGDNAPPTKKALQELVQLKTRKKAMETALGRLGGSADAAEPKGKKK